MANSKTTATIRAYAKTYGNRGVHELFRAALQTAIGRDNDKEEHRGRSSLEEKGYITVREALFHGLRAAGIMEEEGSRGFDLSTLKKADIHAAMKMCYGERNAPVVNLVDVTEAFSSIYGKTNTKTAKEYAKCLAELENIDENLFARRVTLKFKPSEKAQELKLPTYDRDYERPGRRKSA
jgi:hypothetical protein